MAASVAQFGQNANWFNVTTKTVTGMAWTSGDVIVVLGGAEDAGITVNTPTNASLTFTLRASQTTGAGSESSMFLWSAVAGSSQTGQTIQATSTPSATNMFGICAWAVTGTSGTVANATSNRTESAFSVNPTTGSVVIYGAFDYSATATKTILAGTGTATERVDTTNTSNYGIYAGDWANVTAGATNFGISSYAGMTVSHCVIEVLASGAAPPPTQILLMPARSA